MDAKGHLQLFLRVSVQDDAVVLEAPAARRDALEKTLVHYRVAAPVRFAAGDEQVMGIVGPGAVDAMRAAGALSVPDLAAESHATIVLAGVDVRLCRASDLPDAGFVLHVPAAGAEAVRAALDAAGALPVSRAALDALRIEEGKPWFEVDVTDKNLLHETGLLSEYHSFTKGCYVGQEVVARLVARGGNVSQRLSGLRLGEARAAGTVLRAGGKDAGRITTSAVSPRQGPIAMGYVHRDHTQPGTVLDADGTSATVAPLPMMTV
jgi:folate-binding protein YgfZ